MPLRVYGEGLHPSTHTAFNAGPANLNYIDRVCVSRLSDFESGGTDAKIFERRLRGAGWRRHAAELSGSCVPKSKTKWAGKQPGSCSHGLHPNRNRLVREETRLFCEGAGWAAELLPN